MAELLRNSNLQAPAPSAPVALDQLIATAGEFPERAVGGTAVNTLAMVHGLAGGNYPAFGAASCDGRQLPIDRNQALFSVLGFTYGGDGQTSFALPDLRERVAVGGAPSGPAGRTLSMTWMIAAPGTTGPAYPMTGALGLFAGNYVPSGWMPCNGTLVPISQAIALFEVLGTTFGGDGKSVFGLPNLDGAAPIGVGQAPGGPSVDLGEAIDASANGGIAALGFHWIINMTGELPPSQGGGGFPDAAAVLGEVAAWGGWSIPDGWAAASGDLLPISGNQALFELIGTTYGGDGKENFALPDLRGQMVAGLSG